jgi:2-keto-4-pentenoate hydratase/2-oxohepta-3-ene-1,7-dioic acid hydratase in catechol pathway
LAGADRFVPLPFASMLDLIAAGEAGLSQARAVLAAGPARDLAGIRLAAPIPQPARNIFCLGWNYAEHSREAAAVRGKTDQELPRRPIFFTKATTSVLAPDGEVPLHSRVTSRLDYEGELGVILGRGGVDLKADQAMDGVFGYTIINDVSARDVQTGHGGQFFKGKSLDGTCPMGPWIVTRDEVADPHALAITTRVNGVLKQNGNTSDMIFRIPETLEWLSLGLTLVPGDIIATGTPAGVGFARNPPEYLQSGDRVEVAIEGLGCLANRIL